MHFGLLITTAKYGASPKPARNIYKKNKNKNENKTTKKDSTFPYGLRKYLLVKM